MEGLFDDEGGDAGAFRLADISSATVGKVVSMGSRMRKRRWEKIHALRGCEDEAKDEAGFAMPAISPSVMASWESIPATSLVLLDVIVQRVWISCWALMSVVCGAEGVGGADETRSRGSDATDL